MLIFNGNLGALDVGEKLEYTIFLTDSAYKEHI